MGAYQDHELGSSAQDPLGEDETAGFAPIPRLVLSKRLAR
jgi:hypothetical protein